MKVLSKIVGTEGINLDEYPDLKVLGVNMTGLDHLPLEECKKRSIKIISLQGETEFLREITSTTEHTMGLIIALLRGYKRSLNAPYKDRDKYTGHTLKGKTLGIIGGTGRIGWQMRNMAIYGFNMDIISVDSKSASSKRNTLLQKSDIITLHIPLRGNESFFTKEMFKQMKPTAYFINTSRSKIVEDGVLLWALENNIIAGAAIDFIDDPDLLEYSKTNDNLILTPHQGGNTFEDREKTYKFIEKKVEQYLQNN